MTSVASVGTRTAPDITATAAAVAVRLLDDYERGAKFERVDAKDVLLRVDERSFPEAFSPGGREVMETLLSDIDTLDRAGAVRVIRQRVRGGGEQIELRLGPGEVPRAYAAAVTRGFQPLRASLDLVASHADALLTSAASDPAIPEWWRTFLTMTRESAQAGDLRPLGISTRTRIKTEWPEVRDALTAADRLTRAVDTWARHMSEALFADSKRLTAISGRVAALLRSADPRWADADAADPSEVLQEYGIRRRPATITCAGGLPVRLGGNGCESWREYQLADFEPAAILPAAWGPALANGVVAAGVRTVTTIENEYPFLSYVEESGGPSGLAERGELVVWSSGFLGEHLLDLLGRIAERRGSQVKFRHWGDADPAGLSIWWQIRSRLGCPVSLFRSTPEWVTQAASREGQALSDAERRLLSAHAARFRAAAAQLRFDEAIYDLLGAASMAETLLRLGIKVEQERQ